MSAHRVSLDDRILIHDHVIARQLDGETVMVNLETGMYFGLDPIATRAWTLIGDHHRLGAVFDVMLAEYDVAAETLRADLLKLADQLVAKRLVLVAPAEANLS